jgi:hypothetical protein
MNRSRYREHEVRQPDPEVIARLASKVYHEGRGVYFTPEQLERMPQWSRELIESEAARCNGPRRRA